MERFGRLSNFEFYFPEDKIEQKYEWLKDLSKMSGSDYVTVSAIKEYQDEKAKPYFHDVEVEENIEKENADEENRPINLTKTTIIDISLVKDIYEKILDGRLNDYKKQI